MKSAIILILFFVIGSFKNIQSQNFSINSKLTTNLSKSKYSGYIGFSVSGYFPVFSEKIHFGPYLSIFKTKIPYWVEHIPEAVYNRAFVFGVKTYFYPIKAASVFRFEYQPYFGIGLGYQLNHISSTSNMPFDFENVIRFDKIENDFVSDLYIGFLIIPKRHFLQLFVEITYQIRNPKLSYYSDAWGENIFHENQINLNTFFLDIGIRWVFE